MHIDKVDVRVPTIIRFKTDSAGLLTDGLRSLRDRRPVVREAAETY